MLRAYIYCRPELSPLAALLLPTFPNVHSSADGGPLNFALHCAFCAPHFTLHTLHFKLTRHTLHATLHTRQFTLKSWRSLHATVYTLNFTLHTLHSNFFYHTLHPTPHALHFTLRILHLALNTSIFTRGTHTLRFTLSHFSLYTCL